MFLYGRKISFIDYYINGIKNGNVGVVRQKMTEEGVWWSVELFGLEQWNDFLCPVYVGGKDGKCEVCTVEVKAGCGKSEIMMPYDKLKAGQKEKLFFAFDRNCYGVCNLFAIPENLKNKNLNLRELEAEEEELMEECLEPQPDKWERMKQRYPILYPFRGQGPYISIKPVDLQLLDSKYHSLSGNSFLMHGFCKYRHLILGEYASEGNTFFYVGVPGEFGRKDQSSAAMFGFEGYEYSGDLGYYLYRVEL